MSWFQDDLHLPQFMSFSQDGDMDYNPYDALIEEEEEEELLLLPPGALSATITTEAKADTE
jgi:hypothetical protein